MAHKNARFENNNPQQQGKFSIKQDKTTQEMAHRQCLFQGFRKIWINSTELFIFFRQKQCHSKEHYKSAEMQHANI